MALELEDIADSADITVRRLYMCVDCGTLASTNSAKHHVEHYVGYKEEREQLTRQEAERLNEEEGMAVDHERGVRMEPPCPCGCDVFNTTEVLAVYYNEQQTPFVRMNR